MKCDYETSGSAKNALPEVQKSNPINTYINKTYNNKTDYIKTYDGCDAMRIRERIVYYNYYLPTRLENCVIFYPKLYVSDVIFTKNIALFSIMWYNTSSQNPVGGFSYVS